MTLETWDHAVLCDEMKDKRDAHVKKIEKSFHDVPKKVKASMHEINMVKEMIKDIVKHFNKEIFFWKNQQVIGLREVTRGFVVKS